MRTQVQRVEHSRHVRSEARPESRWPEVRQHRTGQRTPACSHLQDAQARAQGGLNARSKGGDCDGKMRQALSESIGPYAVRKRGTAFGLLLCVRARLRRIAAGDVR